MEKGILRFPMERGILGFPMEKGKIIEAEFALPEVIIQHIQSFLCGKEAARSTILSKSWYKAWLSRPNLDFDQYDVAIVRTYYDTDAENKFWNLVKKTVQRYEQLNLKIDSFRLQMDNPCYNNAEQGDIYSLANEVIVKALKMGAADLDFVIFRPKRPFVLSNEVLESENLIRLSLSDCKIELGADGKVGCSRLESLSLCNVKLEASAIWDIISSCPLIQKLSLCKCKFLLETTEVAFDPLFAKGKLVDSRELSKLKYLLLDRIEVHTSFFHDFSTKFPCVKELSVHHCGVFKAIQISGPSLECISFKYHHLHRILKVRFDVPNLRKFTFSGALSPSLSFKTDRSNWESDISIMCCCRPSAAWFLNLNFFLTMLEWSDSKVSLSIQILPLIIFDHVEKLQGLPKPLVENLNLKICEPSSNGPAFLDILFCCCRPVFIPQSWLPEWSRDAKSNNEFVEIVYKRLMQQVSHQYKPGPNDVVEVRVELFYEAVSIWLPVLWESLQDASISAYQEAEIRIRFHLIWGSI